MANIQFQQFLEAFSTGITQVYEDGLKQHTKTYPAILREEKARHWFDTEWMTSGLGAMPRKGIGAAVSTDTILKSPTKQHELDAYALAVVVEYEAMRWDLYGVFEGLPEELAKSAVDRYNVLGYALYNNSFNANSNSAYQIIAGGTAENIISTSHVRLDGGAWSNGLTGNPGLSYLALQDAKINLGKLVNQRGRFVVVSPGTLITSVDQEWIADEIVMSQWRPDNANQNVNLFKGKLKTHASPYLTTPQYWWILSDKRDIKMYMRLGEGPMLKRDQDIRTQSLIVMSYCSMNTACYNSMGLVGSTGGA